MATDVTPIAPVEPVEPVTTTAEAAPVTAEATPTEIATPVAAPVPEPTPAEQVVPALDALAKQTHISDIIRDVDSAGAKVTAWLQGHVDVAGITEHLNAVRSELGSAIGLVIDEVGNLVAKEAPKIAEVAQGVADTTNL